MQFITLDDFELSTPLSAIAEPALDRPRNMQPGPQRANELEDPILDGGKP